MMPLYVPPSGGSPADLIEALAAEVTAAYTRAEQDVQRILARRVYRDLHERPDDTARLEYVQRLRTEAADRLSRVPDDVAEQVIRVAVKEGTAAATARLDLAEHLPRTLPFTRTSALGLAQIAMDLQNAYDQVTHRILRYDVDEYQKLIARAVPNVLLGVEGTLQAQKRAVGKWLSENYPTFIDKGGRAWRVGSYVEMATRTAVQRAYTDAGVHRMHEAGVTLVNVVVGSSACKYCAEWAGRVLSTDGTPPGIITIPNARTGEPTRVSVAGTLEQAREEGLMHPNCRCTVTAYLPGFPIVENLTTYDPAAEAARDRQRALEREIRSDKRRLALTEDDADQSAIRSEIRDTQKQLREHIEEHDLPRMRWREQLHFADGKKTPAA